LDSEAIRTRHALHAILLPVSELNQLFTDEQLVVWQTEAQAMLTHCGKDSTL